MILMSRRINKLYTDFKRETDIKYTRFKTKHDNTIIHFRVFKILWNH